MIKRNCGTEHDVVIGDGRDWVVAFLVLVFCRTLWDSLGTGKGVHLVVREARWRGGAGRCVVDR